MKTIADRYLPFPRILHPWPEKRFLVTIQGGRPVRVAPGGICVNRRPIGNRDPGSASKRDPTFLRLERLIALAPSELVGVAETARAG